MQPIITDTQQIDEVLTKGVKEIFPTKEKLKELMLSGKKIRLYTGIDPTADFIHMGHMIWMKKLAQFHALGHEVIFLIGGFTAMIGDPDKKYTREPLTKEKVMENFSKYKNDAAKILNFDDKENPIRILNNYDWLSKLTLEDWMEISSQVTLQHMISHDMFKNRLTKELPIRIHELMYPLLQGYDGVHMEVDLEVGGSDQTFNMLTGRILSRNLKNIEKNVLTLKLLTDNSGKKMGKTTNNAISFKDSANDVYGKVMSFSDEIIPLAYELLSDNTIKQIEIIIKELDTDPMKVKKQLALEVTTLMHNQSSAIKAEQHFASTIQKKEVPTDMPEINILSLNIIDGTIKLIDLLDQAQIINSRGEGKRLIIQGGVKLNSEKVTDPLFNIQPIPGMVLQIGKRKWLKLN